MVKTGEVLREGDQIVLDLPAALPEAPYPEEIPLKVLYRDDDLAVIEKPSGMVCHIGAGVRSGTLVNALLHHLGPLQSGDPMRPGIVHRLDKPTSGLLVVARNNEAHRGLAQQFKSRRVTKIYTALVYGTPKPASGTVDLPLGRDPKDRKKFSVRARRHRKAVTHYSLIREIGPFSLLDVRIETGRTHQIRVHLAQKGHPIVGDALYGGKRSANVAPAIADVMPERLFLHACQLEFHHPRTGDFMKFTSPIPQELEDVLARIARLLRGEQSRT
jgi:23S rRNA pseudouridine1911/1915/1917 synthase